MPDLARKHMSWLRLALSLPAVSGQRWLRMAQVIEGININGAFLLSVVPQT